MNPPPQHNNDVVIRPIRPGDHDEWLRMRRALWPDVEESMHELEMPLLGGDTAEQSVLVVDNVELSCARRLVVEKLHDGDSAEVLLQKGVDLRHRDTNFPKTFPHALAKPNRDADDQRNNRAAGQRQLRAEMNHRGQNENQRQQVAEHRDNPRREHLVERIDVGGCAGDQPPHRVAVVKRDAHPVKMRKNLLA